MRRRQFSFDREPVLHLTTTGRMTGRPHVIEIWFAHRHPRVYLLSGGRDRSDWVRNLLANPEVTVSVGGAHHRGRGRVVDEAVEARVARDAVFSKYQPTYAGDLTSWRESSLPIAIDLASV